MEGVIEKRFGSCLRQWKARYLVLNRDILQSYAVNGEGGPDINDMRAEIFLPEMDNIEAMPNYRLNLTFEDESLWELRFRDAIEYQCWLSCFVVFHADSLPFVPSTYLDGIWTAFEYIQQHSWKVEGLFRVPGLKCETLKLTKNLIQAGTIGGEPVNLVGVDIKTLCSASKMLIDKLPATLLTEHLYELFIAADKEDGLKLANLVYQLPPQNSAILQHILFTLTKIADETEVTKMNSKNLGILFGTMFVSRTKSVHDWVLDIQDLQQLISSLITFYDIIFKDSKPSYPLYVPRLQRDLLEAQNIDIQDLKSKLTIKETSLSSMKKLAEKREYSESFSSSLNLPNAMKMSSLAFLDINKEKKIDEMAKVPENNVRLSQQQGGQYPSQKLEQLFMTIRGNAFPRDTEFAGNCCNLLRRRAASNENSAEIDKRRTTRFHTNRSSRDTSARSRP